MQLHGWGRFPGVTAELLEPPTRESIQKLFGTKKKHGPMIARGAGRSYGDSSLADTVLSSRFLDSFLEFNATTGIIKCGAGVSMGALLTVIIPEGFFAPVLPGTKFVSVGGAIAADIHGKNHHTDGSFCDHVRSFSLLLSSGEIIQCSRNENKEAFLATCGGMGLTGIIINATISLHKVSSVFIKRNSIIAKNLDDCMDLIDQNEDSKHSFAWLDCLARGKSLGRSILHLADHCADGPQQPKSRVSLSVPFATPGFFLNRFSNKLFNNAIYEMWKHRENPSIVNYDSYFFPLDNIRNWNRLYGSKGFLQYQFVMPSSSAREGIREILKIVSESSKGSFISVLKKFGNANQNLLSFPTAGYTLALDFKNEPNVFPLLNKLDEVLLAHGGRLYLAKDSRMSEDVFKAAYPNWERFVEIKKTLDPSNTFVSRQSMRLGLTQ